MRVDNPAEKGRVGETEIPQNKGEDNKTRTYPDQDRCVQACACRPTVGGYHGEWQGIRVMDIQWCSVAYRKEGCKVKLEKTT